MFCRFNTVEFCRFNTVEFCQQSFTVVVHTFSNREPQLSCEKSLQYPGHKAEYLSVSDQN